MDGVIKLRHFLMRTVDDVLILSRHEAEDIVGAIDDEPTLGSVDTYALESAIDDAKSEISSLEDALDDYERQRDAIKRKKKSLHNKPTR